MLLRLGSSEHLLVVSLLVQLVGQLAAAMLRLTFFGSPLDSPFRLQYCGELDDDALYLLREKDCDIVLRIRSTKSGSGTTVQLLLLQEAWVPKLRAPTLEACTVDWPAIGQLTFSSLLQLGGCLYGSLRVTCWG